ncbi:MAG: c-type cytochrome [Acidimicrobiia bacterium]
MTERRRRAAVRVVAALAAPVSVLTGCGGEGGGVRPGPALSGPAAEGEALVARRGCLSCHSTDGSAGTGPTWRGLAGADVRLADGRTVVADAGYLRRSILDPDADTAAGFPAGLMASAVRPGSVSEAEADAIVAYLQSLGNSEGPAGD